MEYIDVKPMTRRQLDDLWEVKATLSSNDFSYAAVRVARDTRYPVDGHGVDTAAIQLGGERMGLYFVTSGAGMRATKVIYHRAYASFAAAPASAWDWDTLFDGVDWFHLSGITPALGPVLPKARSPQSGRHRSAALRFRSTAIVARSRGSAGMEIRAPC